MPDNSQRPRNQPDPSESRERADPSKEAGLGQMSETRNTPVQQPEQAEQDRAQNERHRERTADEITDQSEGISPTDARAHGGRVGTESEATGKVRRSPEQEKDRGVQE